MHNVMIKIVVCFSLLVSLCGCATLGQNEYIIGEQLLANNSIDGAIGHFEAALQAEPTNLWFSMELIYAYQLKKEYAKAAQFADKLVSENPTNGYAYLTLGISKLGLNEHGKALELMLKGASLNKEYPNTFSGQFDEHAQRWITCAYFMGGDFEGARAYLSEQSKTGKSDFCIQLAAISLIVCDSKLGRTNDVFQDIGHLFDLLRVSRNEGRQMAGNPRKLEPNPENVSNIVKVIRYKIDQGDYKGARDLSNSLSAVSEASGAFITGLIDLAELKHDDAIRHLKRATNVKPFGVVALSILMFDSAANSDYDGFLQNQLNLMVIGSSPEPKPADSEGVWQKSARLNQTLRISNQIRQITGK